MIQRRPWNDAVVSWRLVGLGGVIFYIKPKSNLVQPQETSNSCAGFLSAAPRVPLALERLLWFHQRQTLRSSQGHLDFGCVALKVLLLPMPFSLYVIYLRHLGCRIHIVSPICWVPHAQVFRFSFLFGASSAGRASGRWSSGVSTSSCWTCLPLFVQVDGNASFTSC